MFNQAQIRYIKRYAKMIHVDDDTACRLWCELGYAEKWRERQ